MAFLSLHVTREGYIQSVCDYQDSSADDIDLIVTQREGGIHQESTKIHEFTAIRGTSKRSSLKSRL